MLMHFPPLGSSKMENTLLRLLDQSQAGLQRRENATYPPFGAYLRTLPQGVELFNPL